MLSYLKKDKDIYLSLPRSYNSYTSTRNISSKEHQVYKEVLKNFGFSDLYQPIPHLEEPFFSDEPSVYIKDLYTAQTGLEPEYLINCYHAYQLTDRINPALYIKKSLNLKKTKAFSITNQGILSPYSAIQWTILNKCDSVITCLEYMYSYAESCEKDFYDKCDAATVFKVSFQKNLFKICNLYNKYIDGLSQEINPITRMVEETVNMINHICYTIPIDQLLVIPHSINNGYKKYIQEMFPYTYCRDDERNLMTADPFYSIEEAYYSKKLRTFNILISIDKCGQLGCILLKNEGENNEEK